MHDTLPGPDLAGFEAVEQASRLLGGRPRPGVRPRTVRLYAAWAVLLFVAYALAPQLGLIVYGPVIVSTITVMIVGTVRNRPRRRLPWVLFTGAYVAFATASMMAFANGGKFPSAADAVFLGLYLPLLLGGFIALTRSGAPILDRASTLDAIILTIGAGFLAWTFLIQPFLRHPDLPAMTKLVSVAYPITDVLILAVLARLGLGAARTVSGWLLVVSVIAMLTSDTMYGLDRLNSGFSLGGPTDLGWLVFYLAGGLAVLHPSMAKLTEPHLLSRTQVSLRRGVLTVASLLAPAALMIQALRGPVLDGAVIASVSAVMILLALSRTAAVAASLRQTLARERELRQACESLLLCADAEAVTSVLRHAVGRLLPDGTRHRVELTLSEDGPFPAPMRVAPDSGDDFDLALHCPLGVGSTRIGELLVAGDEASLVELQQSLPVLAGQAATMIDRIRLNRELNRQESQLYVESELLARAYLDPLTGLGNRTRFTDDAARVAGQAGPDRLGAVLVVNVDDFRAINDTMGHDVGDGLLIALGARLTELVGDRGQVSRLGADEFGIVLPDARDVGVVDALAERIIAVPGEGFAVGESLVTARLRAGVATTLDAASANELAGQADVALDSARSAGEPRWRRYDAALHAQVIDEMQLRTELSRALADDAFRLNYQPIVEMDSGRTVGFEALLRWPHPTRGMVSPAVFVPLAEESGLIVELGAWVLHTAVHEAASWARLVPGVAPYVSVNVSVRQFLTPGFVARVHDELASSGLPAERLTLEITESLLLGDQDQIQADITRLRAGGIKVSIDDFGTGYSSLSYLHRVPVDTLKLDKSFVDTITTSARQHDLVRGILRMAATLSLSVVAEGIETEDEHRMLAAAGCAFGQGFLFARPLTDVDARARVAAPASDGRVS
ncbi:bifunctional diguanylate cyclase/phosphodiesterase [Actinoplanes bogorensis]|uniref:Bifunctional diguanylate cyclase/phosphodiesterase n=1 Tax=Paractinoplanes bogorensis TaxID=1610840 RepID=A0ABS5YU45_9ACTN|nr:bifunctional diguanylate cyclase/phosphodiesterase [Actinoplanes bogorensis]MBU2666986.1 bifunctional diguanylate cyclase/phosphodiesterase [Actinoplanes bogorensis]